MAHTLDLKYKMNYFCNQIHVGYTENKEKYSLSVPVEMINSSTNLDAFAGFAPDNYSGIDKHHKKIFTISEELIRQFSEIIKEAKLLDNIKFEEAKLALQNNKKLYDLIIADLSEKQIPLLDIKITKSRGISTTSKVPNALSKNLRELCGIDCSLYDPSRINALNTELSKMKEHLNIYQSKILNIENEKAAKESMQKKFMILGQIAGKHNASHNTTPQGVFDELLSQDKYLALGHALFSNRSDWSNGCSYAKEGISYFTVANSLDSDISAEIWDLIDNWDGDGRCFRDCLYNYDKLFELANAELYRDYVKIRDLFADEIN